LESGGSMTDQNSKLDIGLGLRAPHYSHILEHKPKISWFEAISENYIDIEGGGAGRPLHILEKIRENYPVVLHGVSLSIGSTDDLNKSYLLKLRNLAEIIQPSWMSDHVCWTGVHGENLHDLLPLPYTEETIDHLVDRIKYVQDFLGRRFTFENVSAYLSFSHSEMTEWEFLSELSRRADCDLLLDINNIYVSSINQGFHATDFLNGVPAHRIKQMHLAGHSFGNGMLIDTHDAPVTDEVWKLYTEALTLFPKTPTLIEWDDKIPDFDRLLEESRTAKVIWDEAK
jgi:uncharacterized protein (UPF0276 family)